MFPVATYLFFYNMSRAARKPTLWTLRKVSIQICLNMPRRLTPPVDFSVSGILTLYLYPSQTECVGPDQSARKAQADLGRYITQRPYCWFSRGTAQLYSFNSFPHTSHLQQTLAKLFSGRSVRRCMHVVTV